MLKLKFSKVVGLTLCLLPFSLQASFIESTMGTAVVNDATAAYYNPAALTLLKKRQIIALGAVGRSQTHFTGTAIQLPTNFIQNGDDNIHVNYFLPSLYAGFPIKKKLRLGIAVVGNDFNQDLDGFSILRYAKSNNRIQGIDVVPAFGFQYHDTFSFGVGLNWSSAHFLLRPTFGLPALGVPDAQSRNDSHGTSMGGDVGLLLKPTASTTLGLNYRSRLTYRLHGSSIFTDSFSIISDNYHFKFWTPARTVFSINQFVTKKLGLIGTVQFIQWGIFKKLLIHNIATPLGILPEAKVPYHFHNTWLLTLGTHYRASSKWVIRIAGNYTESPSNGRFQIGNGDALTLGGSIGYTLSKHILIDGGYAHAFILKQNIQSFVLQNIIQGTTKGFLNAFALKLTWSA